MNNKKEYIGMANLFESKLTSSEDFVLYDGKIKEAGAEYGTNQVRDKFGDDMKPGDGKKP